MVQSDLAIMRVEGGRILKQKLRYSEVRVMVRFPFGRFIYSETSKSHKLKVLLFIFRLLRMFEGPRCKNFL
jgi:hypothetical protein